jgi:hypothetical protein
MLHLAKPICAQLVAGDAFFRASKPKTYQKIHFAECRENASPQQM